MNCKQAKEQFLDLLAADAMPTGSPVGSHVAGCAECAAALASLKSTMAMLDEWKAPASSAYFNTRLRAKWAEVRREEAMPRSWASRIWTPAFLRPALVAAMGLAFVVGMNFYQPKVTNQSTNKVAGLQKGTAVADLQALETNHDLYADFDLLDDIGSNHAPVAETTNQGPGSQL